MSVLSGYPFSDVVFLGFTFGELLALTAVMAFATVVQMAVGVGLGLCMAPLLALVAPALVPAPAALAALTIMTLMAWGRWRLVDKPGVVYGAGGLLVGTAAGVAALGFIDPAHLPRLFGALVLVVLGLTVAGLKLPHTPAGVVAASLPSGFMGGMSAIHGPLIGIVYAGQDPARVRATLGVYWFIAYSMLIALHLAFGRVGLSDLVRGAALLPGVALGVALARPVAARVDAARMRRGILLVATLSALLLIVRG